MRQRRRRRRADVTQPAIRSKLVASRQAAAGRGTAQGGPALRGDDDGGRCFAPTALRCSPRGRAAKLAALASRAPLRQSPRVRSTRRASRADPEAALLGAADTARPGPTHGRPRRSRRTAAPCRMPLWMRGWCSKKRPGRSSAAFRLRVHVDVSGKGAGRSPRGRLCAAEKRRSAGPRAQRANLHASRTAPVGAENCRCTTNPV